MFDVQHGGPKLGRHAPAAMASRAVAGRTFAQMLHDCRGLRVHYVSRPAAQDSAGFFDDYRDFDAHCVSRSVPGNFGQRIALQRRSNALISTNALAKPALNVVIRMARVPRRARAPMTRLLARPVTAPKRAEQGSKLEPISAAVGVQAVHMTGIWTAALHDGSPAMLTMVTPTNNFVEALATPSLSNAGRCSRPRR
jgi:hypothetical protein